jgi:cobalamin biosynthesis protein CobT
VKNRVINEERLFNSIVSGALALCGLSKVIPVRKISHLEYPACTDGKTIEIFIDHEVFCVLTGTDRLCACVGAVMHELGHILFSNFLVRSSIACGGPRNVRALLLDRPEPWYDEGVAKLEIALEDYPQIWDVFWSFQNSTEDGYIEKAVSRVIRGKYAAWMRYFRRHLFFLDLSVSQIRAQIATGMPEFYALLMMMHQYVTSGRVKAETEAERKDPALIKAGKALSDLDMASSHPDQLKRMQYAFAVLVRFADEVIEYAKKCSEDAEKGGKKSASASSPNPGATGTGSGTTLAKKVFKEIADEESAASEEAKAKKASGKKGREKASSKPGKTDPEKEEVESKGAEPVEKDDAPDESPSEKSSEEADESEENEEPETEKGVSAEKDSEGEPSDEEPIDLSAQSGDDAGKSDDDDEALRDVWDEEPRLMPTEGEAAEVEGGKEDTVSESSLVREGLASALSDMIQKLETETSEPDASRDILENLRAINRSIPYADIHRGVGIEIEKQVSTDRHYEEWNAVKPQIQKIVARCTKGVEKAIAERIRGGKKTGLMIGSHIDASRACRNDGKVFFNKRLPQKDLDVALAVLIDESGSMNGGRILAAQTMALVMHEIARKLKIPVGIYGHTTSGFDRENHGVKITMYADLSRADEHGCARLMGIRARYNNRDGAALAFVMHRLQKRSERTKIIFMVCDGQPADNNYYGSEAENDLRGIKNQIRRQGMSLVVAAIGDDKDAIERIYDDSFLDIGRLEDLPQRLSKKLLESINVR